MIFVKFIKAVRFGLVRHKYLNFLLREWCEGRGTSEPGKRWTMWSTCRRERAKLGQRPCYNTKHRLSQCWCLREKQ